MPLVQTDGHVCIPKKKADTLLQSSARRGSHTECRHFPPTSTSIKYTDRPNKYLHLPESFLTVGSYCFFWGFVLVIQSLHLGKETEPRRGGQLCVKMSAWTNWI